VKRLKLSDDEAIATAMLHGCEPWRFSEGVWYCRNMFDVNVVHPVEREIGRRTGGGGLRFFFESREELARTYCEYYKLDVEEEKDETT
jgi:hypothetical protein